MYKNSVHVELLKIIFQSLRLDIGMCGFTLPRMRRFIFLIALVTLAGCATTRDEHIVPYTEQQVRALLRNARPPQAFGLTVYNTERGAVFAGAHRMHAGHSALLPFLSRSDEKAPIVFFSARGIPKIHALIDTASRENWIVPSVARSVDMIPLAGPNPFQIQAVHVYDEIGGYAALLHKLAFGSMHVENVVFYIRAASGPLGPPARWVRDPEPAAVLGAPFLRALSYATFDFPARKIFFSATTPFPGASEETLIAKIPLLDIRGVIGADGMLNGEPATFIIDTGGDFDLAMNEPIDATVRRLSLGELVFPRDVSVAVARDIGLGEIEYPRIGRGLLARYKVTFDFRARQIWFERPVSQQ
jgi:hypothetical protein